MAEDMHDLAQARQRQRTAQAKVKMDAMRELRNLCQDHDTAIFLVAELMVWCTGDHLTEIAELGHEFQRRHDEKPYPQD